MPPRGRFGTPSGGGGGGSTVVTTHLNDWLTTWPNSGETAVMLPADASGFSVGDVVRISVGRMTLTSKDVPGFPGYVELTNDQPPPDNGPGGLVMAGNEEMIKVS
jgi:hypothetical protein